MIHTKYLLKHFGVWAEHPVSALCAGRWRTLPLNKTLDRHRGNETHRLSNTAQRNLHKWHSITPLIITSDPAMVLLFKQS